MVCCVFAAAEALQQLSASPSDPVESTRRPTKSAHGTIAFFPDVTGRHSMVAAALKWAPMAGPDPEPLDTSTIGRVMTRAVCIDFLVGPKEWRQLLYTPVRVRSNRIIQVGNSSIVRDSFLTNCLTISTFLHLLSICSSYVIFSSFLYSN